MTNEAVEAVAVVTAAEAVVAAATEVAAADTAVVAAAMAVVVVVAVLAVPVAIAAVIAKLQFLQIPACRGCLRGRGTNPALFFYPKRFPLFPLIIPSAKPSASPRPTPRLRFPSPADPWQTPGQTHAAFSPAGVSLA